MKVCGLVFSFWVVVSRLFKVGDEVSCFLVCWEGSCFGGYSFGEELKRFWCCSGREGSVEGSC